MGGESDLVGCLLAPGHSMTIEGSHITLERDRDES